MEGFVALVTQIRKRLHIGTPHQCPNLTRKMRMETVLKLLTKTLSTREWSRGLLVEFPWITLNFLWLARAQSAQNMTWHRGLAEIDQISSREGW